MSPSLLHRPITRPSHEELGRTAGTLSLETKWQLAQKAFATTAAYDSAIASTLERFSTDFQVPPPANDSISRGPASFIPEDRRPALRREPAPEGRDVLRRFRPRRGQCANRFRAKNFPSTISSTCRRLGPGAGIRRTGLRHCQAHQSLAALRREDVAEAYMRAIESDPVSAFGGVDWGESRP